MKTSSTRLTIVPGKIRFACATRADFATMSRHHYRHRPPATFCILRGAWHRDAAGGKEKLIAIAVLSWPVPMVSARRRWFALSSGYRAALTFANANVRTISRVIVHPQFRSLGLARRLVRQLIDRCPTRYVDALAAMGDFVGCFTAAGMTRVPTPPGEAAYFIIDLGVRGQGPGVSKDKDRARLLLTPDPYPLTPFPRSSHDREDRQGVEEDPRPTRRIPPTVLHQPADV